MIRCLARATPLASLVLLIAAAGCDGSRTFGDRVCPEAYVCSVGCIAGPAVNLVACMQRCEMDTDEQARGLLNDLLKCRDAQCAEAGVPLEACLFDNCGTQMSACMADARKVQNPCPGRTPNEQGIGKECTEQAACVGLQADNCPYAMENKTDADRLSLPQWCNHLCENDDECGSDAFCWQRESVEGAVIGSCALDVCLID